MLTSPLNKTILLKPLVNKSNGLLHLLPHYKYASISGILTIAPWLLTTGFWDDTGAWDDSATWLELFTPLDLFTSGEQGVWYDPSDLTTMFQDAAGTTPVTAVEQPVGLILDKSKGLVLGPELVVNGDFSSGTTGWTIGSGGTAAVTSGVIRLTSTTVRSTASQAISTNVGQRYRVDIGLVSNGTAAFGGAVLRVTSTNSYAGTVVAAAGSTSSNGFLFFTATTATTYIWLAENTATSGAYVEFGGLSIKADSGNHATQPTATARPVLSARYNLLNKTEDFGDAVWLKTAVAVTPNTTVAPDGTTTANRIVPNGVFNQHAIEQQPAVQPAVGTVVLSAYFKADELTKAVIRTFDDVTVRQALFNLSTGTVETGSGTVTADNASITAVGGGWYLCSLLAGTTKGSALKCNLRLTPVSTTASDPGASWSGNSSDGGYIWGASLVPANQASLPYQRVNTATDYDADPTKFKTYLRFDGVDDFLVTNTITPGTDKVQVFAGVRKFLGSPDFGCLLELSAITTANNGAFTVFAPYGGGGQNYQFGSRGTAISEAVSALIYAAPITNVLTGLGDISGDIATLRVNGNQAAQSTADQGTGNYLAYPLYIGRRGGTSLPFNGHLYSLITRFGPNLTTDQITQTENWVNSKTGAY